MSKPGYNMDYYEYKTNQNENLINTENKNCPDIDNPYIINFQDNNNNSYEIYNNKFCCRWMVLVMIMIPPLIPFLIIPFFLLEKKIKISKNENTGELIVMKISYGSCTKRINFAIEDTAIQIRKSFLEEGGQERDVVTIYLYNTSLKEIDLDTSNVKNVPFQSIYIFKNYLGKFEGINSNLSKFKIKTFENKIDDEIKKYVPNFEENNENKFLFQFNSNQKVYDQIIKISDYYYIYYTYNYLYDPDYKEMFKRIDWIFSKNLDRIFIGVVNGDHYLKKIMYNINDIDKFVLMLNNDNNRYSFKICLKDGKTENICQFQDQVKKVLDSFIYLINGQIKNIANTDKIS